MALCNNSLQCDLRVISFNMHGFKSGWSYLQSLLNTNDVVFVQELWLHSWELDLLNNLHSDFVVYAKSGMDEQDKCGLFKGRPFGGVAVFVRKHLIHVISFCCHNDEGRVLRTKGRGRSNSAKFCLDSQNQLPLKGSSFETEQHIGNLKHVTEAQMIALNIDLEIWPTPPLIFTRGQKLQKLAF